MPILKHRQRGAALLVSLMMLLLLTMLAVSAVNMTSLGLKSASNMQDMQLAEAAVQAGIDTQLSGSADFFRNAVAVNYTSYAPYTVNVARPVCLGFNIAPGYEERYGEEINRYDNAWRVDASVQSSSAVNGETAAISQGVIVKSDLTPCEE